jgi:AraC-like DNA-binding protein
MPGSVTSVFSEAEDFETALRSEGFLSLLVTARGQFRARLTQIALRRFRLSAGTEQLSRIAFISVPVDHLLISFPIGKGAAPVFGGIRIRGGEMMILGPCEQVHARIEGPHRWGAIWVPVEELVKHSRILTGVPFSIPPIAQRWRPSPANGRNLRDLHAAATRVAASRPEVITDLQAAHGLEQQLIHAVVECLSDGSGDMHPAPARRKQEIMARFEQLLGAQPDRSARMKEICASLGVSRSLLCGLCAEHLGMSPIAYDRWRRLSSARRALRRRTAEHLRISEIARCHGFADAGRFAAAYRIAFGELPSLTVQRARIR